VDDITSLAERLGKAIADSPQAKRLHEARQGLHADKDLEKLLNDYQDQSEKIARLEGENKPVEVEDKHKLQGLHDRLVSSEPFKKFTAAQVEYMDLMRQVNEAMQAQMQNGADFS